MAPTMIPKENEKEKREALHFLAALGPGVWVHTQGKAQFLGCTDVDLELERSRPPSIPIMRPFTILP